MRAYRQRRKAASTAVAPVALSADVDPVDALADWSRRCLVVPPGHPAAGEPLELPDYGIDFLRGAIAARESLLSIGRKNAKSAIVAVYALGRLVGPLAVSGWRGGVVSVNREKAGELYRQIQAIAEASSLEGLDFRRSPAPGWVQSVSGVLETFSADKTAGHASGFDDVLLDELGLMGERMREMVNGFRSSVSARDGRVIALSVQGDSPFTAELLERAEHPGVYVAHYTTPDTYAIDDPAGWALSNPGLDSIKSREYMEHAAARALATPADAASFAAFDLNRPQSPSRQMLCQPGDWRAVECAPNDLPPRDGPVYVGVDLGGSASMTAAVAVWRSGRVECWAAFPDTPSLVDRGRADGCGNLYEVAAGRGELWTYAGRVTDVSAFLSDVADALAGEDIAAVGADRFRQAEALDALAGAGLDWVATWRGQGASATADGSHDVRATQRAILSGSLRAGESLVLRKAIADSALRYDGNGNPGLDKGHSRGRIDCLSALVIACGLRELDANRPPPRKGRYHGKIG